MASKYQNMLKKLPNGWKKETYTGTWIVFRKKIKDRPDGKIEYHIIRIAESNRNVGGHWEIFKDFEVRDKNYLVDYNKLMDAMYFETKEEALKKAKDWMD